MKNILYAISLCVVLLVGCSKSTSILATQTKNIAPLPFHVQFELDVNKPEHIEEDLFYTTRDKKSLEQMWSEITSDYNINSENPEYFIKITLMYEKGMTVGFGSLSKGVRLDGAHVFDVKFYNKKHELINSCLFKSLVLWKDHLSSRVNGSIHVSPLGYEWISASLKIGLLDILSYTSKGLFLNNTRPVHTFSHLGDWDNFEMPGRHIVTVTKDNPPQWLYHDSACSYLYIMFIMGEDFQSVNDINSSIWTENMSTQYLKIIAKIAKDKKWPLFPENLDVSSVRIEVTD